MTSGSLPSNSNAGVPTSSLSSILPSTPVVAPSNEPAASPRAEESNPACSNGGPGVTSPIEMANGEQPHKIFVGGLSWQTSEDKLRDMFATYGEVTECNIMKDPVSKKSRGFGFVTFKGPETVKKVLDAHTFNPISIDEKTIDPKIAIPPKRLSNKVKRIFVGGLSSESCDEDLKDYFEQFGKVTESQLMYDRNTSRHRGFGFVTFENEEPAEKVCSIQYHDIKGKKVEVKVAQTKEAIAMQQQGRGRIIAQRSYGNSYGGYHGQGYAQFFPSHYPIDMMNMGGYNAPPVMLSGGAGGKPDRGSKNRAYSQYGAGSYPYGPGGWGEHPMGPGFFGPAAFGIHMPMMRGHMGMDPAGMDYMAEQFQGLAMNGGGYYNHSPPSGNQFPAMGGMDHVTSAGSYSPPHTLSPKGIVTSSGINGYNSVATYTGSHSNSYAVAQPSY